MLVISNNVNENHNGVGFLSIIFLYSQNIAGQT